MVKSHFNDSSKNLARVEHDYAIRGDIGDIGRIATNAHQEFRDDRSVVKKQRQRMDELTRIVSDFLLNIVCWSMSDFETYGTLYRGWLNEQAEIAYKNGEIGKGNSLSETAHEFFIKEQAILNNNNLSETQKKEALQALWKDQDQRLIEQFVVQYGRQSSKIAVETKNKLHDQIEEDSYEVSENSTTIQGLSI